MIKKNVQTWGDTVLSHIAFLHHSSSLWKVGGETHGKNMKSRIDAKAMEECYFLAQHQGSPSEGGTSHSNLVSYINHQSRKAPQV